TPQAANNSTQRRTKIGFRALASISRVITGSHASSHDREFKLLVDGSKPRYAHRGRYYPPASHTEHCLGFVDPILDVSCLSFCFSHSRHRHRDRKSTRLNSSHVSISYAVFC